MNRKMRAKLNNRVAKARKERRPCVNEGKVFPPDTNVCDVCGDELSPLPVTFELVPDRRQMN